METNIESTPRLIDNLLSQLQQAPQNIALEFKQLSITNLQLFNTSLSLANKLSKAGIKSQMLIGVLLDRSPEALLCLFALWQLGAVYIPLDPAHPVERLNNICQDVSPDFIITQENVQHKLNGITSQQIILNPIDFTEIEGELGLLKNTDRIKPIVADELAYIIYTSGSGGQPKGVEISQQSLNSLFQNIVPLLALSAEDVFIGLASFSFDISFFELLLPFLLGGKLVLMDSKTHKDPVAIKNIILKKHISIVQATPSLWGLLTCQNWPKVEHTIKAIATGEALPIATANEILKHCPTLWNLYGPTECTIWSTAKKIDKPSARNSNAYISIGKPLPHYKAMLRDHLGKPVNTSNARGELCIGGKGLALAYHNNTSLSAEKFQSLNVNKQSIERFYLSGDICSWDDTGELVFHGRMDNQVKLNGYRVELEEIEYALEKHPSIKQALVAMHTLKQSTTGLLYAFIVHQPGMPNKTATTLSSFLNESLPDYMLPQRYFFIDALPLTNNAKKDRQALLLNNVFETKQSGQSPISNFEKEIAAIFCDVLGLEEIGLYDSFFDAGGNSMLAASLLMALNNRFNSCLSLHEILLIPPTVHSASQLINKLKAA